MNNKSNPTFNNDEQYTLIKILYLLAYHTKIVLATPFITSLLAILYVQFIAENQYISTSKIMSSTGMSNNISQAQGIAAQFGIAIPNNSKEQKWAYPAIITSRDLARSMLKRNFDTKKFGTQKSLLQILTYGNNTSELGIDTLEIIAIDRLLGMISVSEDIKTGIFTIVILGPEPKFVSDINKAIIEELDIHQKSYEQRKTSETRQFIEERIFDVEKELVSAEDSLQEFMDRNRRIENSPALKLEQQRLLREVTVLIGVFTTLKQQYETTKIEEVKDSDYVIVIDKPNTPLNRARPNKKMIVILSGLLGIGFGITLVFMIEFWKKIDDNDKEILFQTQSIFKKRLLSFINK